MKTIRPPPSSSSSSQTVQYIVKCGRRRRRRCRVRERKRCATTCRIARNWSLRNNNEPECVYTVLHRFFGFLINEN